MRRPLLGYLLSRLDLLERASSVVHGYCMTPRELEGPSSDRGLSRATGPSKRLSQSFWDRASTVILLADWDERQYYSHRTNLFSYHHFDAV